jgi:L-threonylcarbamoyladenylate synthase
MRHYAPRARLILVDAEGGDPRKRFDEEVREAKNSGEKLGLMLPKDFSWNERESALVYRWGSWTNEEELAQRLFAGLRWLDAAGATLILCPVPEAKGIGAAIRDRLNKAARDD